MLSRLLNVLGFRKDAKKTPPEAVRAESVIAEPTTAPVRPPDNQTIHCLYVRHLFRATGGRSGELTQAEQDWLDEHESLLNQGERQLAALVPRLPSVLPRIMVAVHRDDVSPQELTELVEQDPVLAANVLRVANSPVMRIRSAQVPQLTT